MQSIKTLAVICCTSLSACGGCEQPKNLPPPAQKVVSEAAKHEPVRRAAYRAAQAVEEGEEAIEDMAVSPGEIQGALVALVNRALVGLDAVKSQVEALEIDYQQFKTSVASEFDSVWTKVNRIDQTLEEFVPAVNLRFESLESRVDKLEQRQGMTYRRRRAE